jgi:outer membrane protein TolC
VEEGKAVSKGQVLAELDTTDYRIAYDAAQGQADAARTVDDKAQEGPRSQELEQARIDFEQCQDQYNRMKFLYDHKSLPANDFKKIEAGYQTAQQRYDMAWQGTRAQAKVVATGQYRTAAAQADAGIAQEEARRAEDEVTLKVKQLYYGLLSAEHRKQAAELRIEGGKERLNEARNGVEAGAVLDLKVLEGQAQIAEARHALGSLEDAISDMKVEFNDLTSLPLDCDVKLVSPEPET